MDFFRHTYIIHILDKLVSDEGMDLYNVIPIISAYVGHSKIKDTEYYIHLCQFHYSKIISAGEDVLRNMSDGDVK